MYPSYHKKISIFVLEHKFLSWKFKFFHSRKVSCLKHRNVWLCSFWLLLLFHKDFEQAFYQTMKIFDFRKNVNKFIQLSELMILLRNLQKNFFVLSSVMSIPFSFYPVIQNIHYTKLSELQRKTDNEEQICFENMEKTKKNSKDWMKNKIKKFDDFLI